MDIFSPLQNIVSTGFQGIGKNIGLGDMNGLQANPLTLLKNIPIVGNLVSGAFSTASSALPLNPSMLGFLGPKGLLAGLAIQGAISSINGFAESNGTKGSGRRPMPKIDFLGPKRGGRRSRRSPMPEIDSRGPNRGGRRSPMPEIDSRGPNRGGRRSPMPTIPGKCSESSSAAPCDVSARIDEIMNSNMSVAEKITMLAALMADVLDQQAEKVMGDWSEEMKRSANQGDHKNKNATEGSKDANNSQYLQVRLQQLMEKKNQLISLASNINKADHTTKSGVIRNIQV